MKNNTRKVREPMSVRANEDITELDKASEAINRIIDFICQMEEQKNDKNQQQASH